MAIRASPITRMILVFDRSRPGTNVAALATAAAKVPLVSPSPATIAPISATNRLRSLSRSAV